MMSLAPLSRPRTREAGRGRSTHGQLPFTDFRWNAGQRPPFSGLGAMGGNGGALASAQGVISTVWVISDRGVPRLVPRLGRQGRQRTVRPVEQGEHVLAGERREIENGVCHGSEPPRSLCGDRRRLMARRTT